MMLGRLLALIRNNQGIISRENLCATMGVTPEMLEELISSLIRMGRLAEIIDNKPVSCPTCEGCILQQQCNLMNLFQEKRYEVVNNAQQFKKVDLTRI
jgi:hypothetical protein